MDALGYRTDVGGQHCPDYVRIYCAVSVGQNQVQIRNPDTRNPPRLKISDFDGQTPYSKPGDVCLYTSGRDQGNPSRPMHP